MRFAIAPHIMIQLFLPPHLMIHLRPSPQVLIKNTMQYVDNWIRWQALHTNHGPQEHRDHVQALAARDRTRTFALDCLDLGSGCLSDVKWVFIFKALASAGLKHKTQPHNLKASSSGQEYRRTGGTSMIHDDAHSSDSCTLFESSCNRVSVAMAS